MEKLSSKTKWKHDGIVNAIRTELDVPMNRSLLMKIAVDAYIKKNTKPNGQPDLKGIAGPLAEMRAELKAERALMNLDKRIAKLKEKQAALEKLKKEQV